VNNATLDRMGKYIARQLITGHTGSLIVASAVALAGVGAAISNGALAQGANLHDQDKVQIVQPAPMAVAPFHHCHHGAGL